MKADRITRVNELIKRELATQLYRVINQPDFDPAVVTITHVITSVDLRNSRVLVSIRAPEERQRHMLSVLKRHRHEFQEVIRKNVVLRYIPHLTFVLDNSIADGDHVLELLQKMQEEHLVPDDAELEEDGLL